MFKLLVDFKKKTGCNVTELRHAYRINGVVDVWKNGKKVFFIKFNKYQDFQNPESIFSFLKENIKEMGTQEAYKQAQYGMTYKEFKNNARYSDPEKSFYSEDYHWKLNLDKIEGDELYFIVISGKIKIGRSKHPKIRLKELRTAIPEPGCLYAFPGKGFMENQLHKCFKDFKINGEWFRDDQRIKDFLKRYHKDGIKMFFDNKK